MRIKNHFVFLLPIILLSGCGYAIIGKKTTIAINALDDNVAEAIGKSRDQITGYLIESRNIILTYLRLNSQKEASQFLAEKHIHKSSIN